MASSISRRKEAAIPAFNPGPGKPFPAWRYGPNGQSGIFESEAEVPEGWEDHPTKVENGSHPKLNAGNFPLSAEQNLHAFGAGREDIVPTNYDEMDLMELKIECGERNIDFHPNAKEAKLRALLAAYDANPPKTEE